MITRFLFTKFALPALLTTSLLLIATNLQAQQLPLVTGVSYDGELVSWDPLEGALGYDIYIGSTYTATVVGTTSYRPEKLGRFVIAAFDGNGNYSQTFPADFDTSTSNFVRVNALATGVDEPMNVTGIVYSQTAGEIFWDRSPSRSLEYHVFLNGAPLGTTTGSSLFINSLSPDSANLISVVANAATGESSEQVVLEFNTQTGPFPSQATRTDDNVPALRPAPPQNVSITVYGETAAELFWDRTPLSTNIVATDVFRDDVLIGTAEGNSYFDGNGTFNFGSTIEIPHTYKLVAIDGDGNRSEPAILNPKAFDPDAFDDSRDSINRRLLAGITEVTNSNPHFEWFPVLQNLTDGGDLELLETITIVDDGDPLFVESEYRCTDSGTLFIETDPTNFGSTFLFFDDCGLDVGYFDGSVLIEADDVGGYSAFYFGFFIDSIDFPVDMDGLVSLNVKANDSGRTLTYTDFNYSYIGNLLDDDGLDTFVTLNQSVSDIVSDEPRHSFETNFTVSAPWTNGQQLNVSTTRRFEGIEASLENETPNYIDGRLIVETGNGETLTLLADTGDSAIWRSAVRIDGSSQTFSGFWDESVRLPCLSATMDDAAITECSFY